MTKRQLLGLGSTYPFSIVFGLLDVRFICVYAFRLHENDENDAKRGETRIDLKTLLKVDDPFSKPKTFSYKHRKTQKRSDVGYFRRHDWLHCIGTAVSMTTVCKSDVKCVTSVVQKRIV